MHSPKHCFLLYQRNSGLCGQSSLHVSKVMTEDQGSSLLGTILLAQLAITGAEQLLPLGSQEHRAMSCPNVLAGSAASLGASVSPLASDARHTYGSKWPINVMFGDTRVCSACWKLGELVRAEDMDLQRFPSLQPGPSHVLERAGRRSSPRPSSRPPVPPLPACHASLSFNSAEPHAGPQGNQGGMSINYLLNLDKYYNK